MNQRPQIETCLSPIFVNQYDWSGKTVVVIDVFRATSTICSAIGHGAEAVIPVSSVEECQEIGEKLGAVMAGERGGHVIEGLQMGNSPLEYTPEVIEGKTLVLTTTNGTRLMQLVKDAQEIVIGSFLNLNAVTEYLKLKNEDIILACSGWRDHANLEDTVFAGAVIYALKSDFECVDDSSFMAESLFNRVGDYTSLQDYLKKATHYHRLVNLGAEADLEYCCLYNLHPIVPVLLDGIIKDVKVR